MSAAQVRRVLLEQGVVSLGHAVDEFVGAGGLGGGDDLLDAGIGLGHGEILADGAAKQEVLLQDHADLPPQMRQVDLAGIDAVEADQSFLHAVEALDQLGQGGFSRTTAADDAHHGAGGNRETGPVEGVDAATRVAEGDVLEGNLAFQLRPQAAGTQSSLRRTVHDLSQHAHGERRLLVLVDQTDHLDQGADHASGQHLESDQHADGHGLVEDTLGANENDDHRHQFAQEVGQRVSGDRQLADLEVGVDGFRRHLVPGLALHRFDGQRLDRAHAVDGFHEQGLAGALGEIQAIQALAEGGQENGDDGGDGERECQNDQRQGHGIGEQQGQEDHQGEGIEPGKQQAAGEELADALQLLHLPGDHAGGGELEEVDRQRQQVAEGAPGDMHVDLVGGRQQQHLAQVAERRIEKQGDRHADGEHGQGRRALVYQDLVDDELEKQRRGESQDVHRHAGDDHVAEGGALLEDLRDEPAQAEGLLGVEERMRSLEQDDVTAPHFAERCLGMKGHAGCIGQGIDDGHLFGVAFLLDANHDHAGPGLETAQQWKHALLGDELLPTQVVRLRLYADVRSHPQHQRCLRLFIGQCEVVDQPLRIDPDALVLGDGGQTLDNAVGEFFGHYRWIAQVLCSRLALAGVPESRTVTSRRSVKVFPSLRRMAPRARRAMLRWAPGAFRRTRTR